ncbi:MAG: O-antigen/teichoic acid export membrane protein [Planctomycetaceae bacterium]|jgi:O-antigen/teichoic acid export membrane protein
MVADRTTEDMVAAITARPGARIRKLAQLTNKFLPALALVASRGSAILAQFAVQLVVGTMAGAGVLGALQLLTSWTCIAGEVLGLGLPTRTMRQVSISYEQQQREQILQTLRESRRKIFGLWLTLVLLVALPAIFLTRAQDTATWTEYSWMLIGAGLAAPLFSLIRLYAESLKATGKALAAVTIESLTSPLVLLTACAYCWLTGHPVVTFTLAITFALSLVIMPVVLSHRLKQQIEGLAPSATGTRNTHAPPKVERGDLFYLWGTGVLSISFMHLPFIVMPLYLDTAQIGVFAVAHKLINVITTLLLLLAAVFGPSFARYAAQNDSQALLGLLRRTQLISTAVFLPVALLLIALAEPLAGLFGEDFGNLQIYLAILAIGHLVNAATGLSGVLMNMAGAASKEMYSLITATIAALAGSAWIGPEYGATGLAIVFSSSIALKNIASYLLAINLLKPTREHP